MSDAPKKKTAQPEAPADPVEPVVEAPAKPVEKVVEKPVAEKAEEPEPIVDLTPVGQKFFGDVVRIPAQHVVDDPYGDLPLQSR